jgi:NAD(P)H-dependent flavin oxidoreductase YrpB (nitropropane dioxygenase family)
LYERKISPLIGGGGVADGRGFYAVLSLGAEAAIVGSRFVLSDECPVHPHLKQALCEANELNTDLIMFSVGFTHRVRMNEPARKTLEIERRGGSLEEILPYVSCEAARKMYQIGDLNAGTIPYHRG